MKNLAGQLIFAYALICSTTAKGVETDLLSFEGGGFRAMVADAGIIGAALKGKQMSAGYLLDNVSVISGNSGGTWFSTCLAYSPEFVSGLEKVDNFFDAKSGGYMGILSTSYKEYVRKLVITDNPVVNSFIKQVGSQKAGLELAQYLKILKYAGSLNWIDALKETVFKPYNTADFIQQTNFKDSLSFRTSALPKQPLVFEISWSTNGAGIGRFSLTNETIATANNIGKDEFNSPYVFTPGSITSLGSVSKLPAPTLPSQNTSDLNVTYATTKPLGSPNKYDGPSVEVQLKDLRFDDLSILSATAASSSAAGLVDSAASLYSSKILAKEKFPDAIVNNLLSALQELAVPVSINKNTGIISDFNKHTDGKMSHVGAVSPSELFQTPILRLADGAYIDNTGITSGLTYLQNNELLHENFNVTAVTTLKPNTKEDKALKSINPGYLSLSPATRALFTGAGQFQTMAGFNVSHLSAAIFDASKTTGLSEPVWMYRDTNSPFGVDYYQLGVTTVPNNFNLKPGLHGTLNLWVVRTADTMTAIPVLAPFNQYKELFYKITGAMGSTYKGKIGYDLVAESLGRQ